MTTFNLCISIFKFHKETEFRYFYIHINSYLKRDTIFLKTKNIELVYIITDKKFALC